MTIMYRKILITIFVTAISILCLGIDLSAQEKKDIKKWEITGYFGAGGNGRDGPIRPFYFNTYCIGVGLEYYFTPRISLEGEINYLPHLGLREEYGVKSDLHRLFWDINLLFYFNLIKVIKKPVLRLFITAGIGYQYDRVEYTVGSFTTLEQVKYGRGQSWFQFPTFGGGLKVNIKGDWSLRFLYKIHRFAGEGLQTNRFALGLSYRF